MEYHYDLHVYVRLLERPSFYSSFVYTTHLIIFAWIHEIYCWQLNEWISLEWQGYWLFTSNTLSCHFSNSCLFTVEKKGQKRNNCISSKYSEALITNNTFSNVWTRSWNVEKLVNDWKTMKTISDTAFCGVWSGSTLFVQACLSA